MFPQLKYKELPGERLRDEVYVYGFSFCEHCARARRFLEEEGLGCSYVLLDAVPAETRKPIEEHFEAVYGEKAIYPVLEVDGRFLFGFNAELWRSVLK